MTKRFNATQINAELFWKFSKFLSENKKYANLTNDDRVAYMLIKDRYRYSLSNIGSIKIKTSMFISLLKNYDNFYTLEKTKLPALKID
ncbi:hypothetical protein IMAU30034_02036 [Lactobacillus helveticus]|nr:hypothetical protein [Lactobacillus helveticus]